MVRILRRALDPSKPVEEFFWNRNLLNDLIGENGETVDNTNEWHA